MHWHKRDLPFIFDNEVPTGHPHKEESSEQRGYIGIGYYGEMIMNYELNGGQNGWLGVGVGVGVG